MSCSDSVPAALACCALISETEQSWASHPKQSLAEIKGFQMEHNLLKVIKTKHITNSLDF